MGKKVLMVAKNFVPNTGGIPTLVENIASSSRHEITVLTGKPEHEDDNFEFNVERINLEGYIGNIRFFWKILKESSDYDLIYLSKPMDSLAALSSLPIRKDVVSHAHGRELNVHISRLRSYVRLMLFRLGLTRIDCFIAVSNFTKSKLVNLGVSESSIEVVHNGVDFEKFSSGKEIDPSKSVFHENCLSLLTVSRLDERKGHDLVMEAIQDLDNVEYIVVGTGSYEERLREKCRELDVEDKVTFVGYLEEEELPDYYASSDLFLMPSKNIEETGNFEGFGLVFLEANAAGKAVIGSNTGGIPDAIRDGETGFLVDTDSEEIREKIVRLKEDERLRSEMGDNAVKWAKEHDWPNVVSKIDEILENQSFN